MFFNKNKKERKYKDKLNKISSVIGYSILDYCEGNYKKTYKILDQAHITNINFKYNKFGTLIIEIESVSPGILIGSKGDLHGHMKYFLKKGAFMVSSGEEVEIKHIETSSWHKFLYPMNIEEAIDIGEF